MAAFQISKPRVATTQARWAVTEALLFLQEHKGCYETLPSFVHETTRDGSVSNHAAQPLSFKRLKPLVASTQARWAVTEALLLCHDGLHEMMRDLPKCCDLYTK